MSTIQTQMQLYHAIEMALRNATESKHPMTLQDLYDRADVAAAAKSKHQVRDKITALLQHKLITKVTVAEGMTGSKRERVGYLWAQMDKHAEDEINMRAVASGMSAGSHNRAAKPSPEVPSENVEVEINGMVVYAGKGVEMYIQNVKCVVDKNPASGLVRIKIQ